MKELYEFCRFPRGSRERPLRWDAKSAWLARKTFKLAQMRIEEDELFRLFWPDVALAEGRLAVMVSHLRKALGDDRGTHAFIETVPRHGYRLVATMTHSTEFEDERRRAGDHPFSGNSAFPQDWCEGRQQLLWGRHCRRPHYPPRPAQHAGCPAHQRHSAPSQFDLGSCAGRQAAVR